MRAHQPDALLRKRRSQLLFHLPLRRPTRLVGGEPQVPAGDEQHFVRCRPGYFIPPR
jgi:hypothetical protein